MLTCMTALINVDYVKHSRFWMKFVLKTEKHCFGVFHFRWNEGIGGHFGNWICIIIYINLSF